MEHATHLVGRYKKTFILDVFLALAVTFLPSVSHMFSVPFYRFDPMRLLIVLAIPVTIRSNSYLLCFLLPAISFFISGHPQLLKAILISLELAINVAIFWNLAQKVGNLFLAMFIGVLFSKVCYYLGKFLLIQMAALEPPLVGTPICIQLIMGMVFSLYLYLFFQGSIDSLGRARS